MATVIIRPTSNNTITPSDAWSHEGVTGATHYTFVNEVTADDVATKLYSPTLNDLNTYNFGTTGLVAETINSVTIYVRALKLDPPASIEVAPVVRIASTNYQGTGFSPSTNNVYETGSHTWTTNPNTAVAWTVAEVDALNAGIIKNTSGGMRVTQVYAEIDYEVAAAAEPIKGNFFMGL